MPTYINNCYSFKYFFATLCRVLIRIMTNKSVRFTIPSEDKLWCVKKSNRKIHNVYPVLYLFRHQLGLEDLIIISSLVDILDLFFRQLYHNFFSLYRQIINLMGYFLVENYLFWAILCRLSS